MPFTWSSLTTTTWHRVGESSSTIPLFMVVKPGRPARNRMMVGAGLCGILVWAIWLIPWTIQANYSKLLFARISSSSSPRLSQRQQQPMFDHINTNSTTFLLRRSISSGSPDGPDVLWHMANRKTAFAFIPTSSYLSNSPTVASIKLPQAKVLVGMKPRNVSSPASSSSNSSSRPADDGSAPTAASNDSINSTSSNEKQVTVVVVMLGLATCMILCAVLLCFVDIKDRCGQDEWVRAHQQRQRQQLPSMIAAATFTDDTLGKASSSAYSYHHGRHAIPTLSLPHGSVTAAVDNYTTSHNTKIHGLSVWSGRDGRDSDHNTMTSSCLYTASMQRQGSLDTVDSNIGDDELLDPITNMYLEYPLSIPSLSRISTIIRRNREGFNQEHTLETARNMDETTGIGITTELDKMFRLPHNVDLTTMALSTISSSQFSLPSTAISPRFCFSNEKNLSARKLKCRTSMSTLDCREKKRSHVSKETKSKQNIGHGPVLEKNQGDMSTPIVDSSRYFHMLPRHSGETAVRDTVVGFSPPVTTSPATDAILVDSSSEEFVEERLSNASDNAKNISMKVRPPVSFDDSCNLRSPELLQVMVPRFDSKQVANTRDDNRLLSERKQMEDYISSIPFFYMEEKSLPIYVDDARIVIGPQRSSSINEFVRDVYFVPLPLSEFDSLSSSSGLLGIQLFNASSRVTHPTVAKIFIDSPLVGRISEGDFILQVNNADTAGLSGDDVQRLIQCTQLLPTNNNSDSNNPQNVGLRLAKMVKITLMSSQSECFDRWSDATNIDSVLGVLVESALEI